jgi:hypothetical protein
MLLKHLFSRHRRRGRGRGRDHIQSVPITTKVVSSNPAHDEVYSIQYYVIKFVSDLRLFCGFRRILQFPPLIINLLCVIEV